MNHQNGPQPPHRKFLPPNLVAFLTGVVLALAIGMVFRKVIDRMVPHKNKTLMRAQTIEGQTKSEQVEKVADKKLSEEADKKIINLSPTSAATAATAEPVQAPTVQSSPIASITPSATIDASEEVSVDETSTGEVEYTTWRKLFRNFEEQLKSQGLKNLNVTMTPRYRHQAKGLAITRGQFLDVVSKKVPANLPTRQANLGVVLHALSTVDFDTQQFNKMANDSSAQFMKLCRSEKAPLNLEGVERITVLLSNTPQSFKCLTDLLEHNPALTKVQELSLVGFTRGSTFYASLSSQKKLLSLQMWNPDWLLDNTVGLEETGKESPAQRRSLRLANVTRALAQPSDVRMQIPASFRPLVGPLIDPRDPTPPKPLVIGNFAMVPSHMPRGSLIATAFTSPGQDKSKSATVKPPGVGRTKALVLATQGKTLQFMSVSRE